MIQFRPRIQYVLTCLLVVAVSWAAPSQVRNSALVHHKALLKAGKSTVAILLFYYPDGKTSSGSSMLSEQMGADLATMKKVHVANRKDVRKKLFNSTVVESTVPEEATIRKIGQVLDVEAVLVGTLTDKENNESDVVTTLYRTDNGKEISKSKSIVTRTWLDEPKFSDPAVP